MISAVIAISLLPFISAATIDVVVGGSAGLVYAPAYTAANVGDIVRFHFQQKNHTATQSTFDSPCSPLAGGFDSGFKPVADTVTSDFPTYDLTVSNTDPIWVYCAQGAHCRAGMVFAVNPSQSGEYTYAAFHNNAMTGTTATTSSAMSGSSTASATSSAATATGTGPVDHRVVVGGTGNIYTPNTVQAKAGDTITFEFRQKNHTISQSSFDNPCRKLEFTSTSNQVGFDSGFFPVAADLTTGFPTWKLTVNDTNPIWAYCRQTAHCGQGMVFAANPTSDKTFDAFKANAIRLNGTATGTTGTSTSTATGTTQSSAAKGALAQGSTAVAFLSGVGVFAAFLL